MYIHGEFRDFNDNLCSVHIVSDNDRSTEIVIGENGLFFDDDPVTIEQNVENTFTHILQTSCTINFVTENYIGGALFANNSRNIVVNVYRGNTCIFAGFIEPNVFTQPFALALEEFSINCTDALSTLQYYNYNNANASNYDELKETSDSISFYSIFSNMFSDLLHIDLKNGSTGKVYYDISKGISKGREKNVFTDLQINESYLYGKTYDDIFTSEEVLTEMMKYLNLHIVQYGLDFYIFDWNTIKQKKTNWYIINTNTNATTSPSNISLTSDMHASSDTSISIADVFNQISVKDKIEDMETVIESPLDDKTLTSPYSNKQKYMTEFISEGSGDTAHDAMWDMLKGNATGYDSASQIDWYMQYMSNPNWKCYINKTTTVDDMLKTSSFYKNGKQINQHLIAKYLRDNQCVPAIFSLGSVKRKAEANDNSLVSKVDMNNYLYISINGNETDTENGNSPTNTTIESHEGMIKYTNSNSGGSFSPVDAETTNYLVFSGKLLLQPIVYETGTNYASTSNNFQAIINNNGFSKSEGEHAFVPHYTPIEPIHGIYIPQNNLVKSDNNGEGRYYVRKFYTPENPNDVPTSYMTSGNGGVQPWTEDKSAHGYEFNYSSIGDGSDKISKIPILECELIIGNKRCVEIDMDMYGNSSFVWVDKNTGVNQTYVDENGNTQTYVKKTFSLGVNPSIGDFIIGDEYDIQNTIDFTMNLNGNVEGTAIPIKMSDALSGNIEFKILGPINLTWNNVTRRHPTFFRHTKWYQDTKYILSHTQNIIIKDFECKVFSDSGKNNITQDNDLVYVSDEIDKYVNKKDDIEFKFITQLTSEECFEKGVKQSINKNSIFSSTTNLPITSIYNSITNETAKPEEHYVNQYYLAYSVPKVILDTELHDNSVVNQFNIYYCKPLNKSFFVQSMSTNVRRCKKHITLKEL